MLLLLLSCDILLLVINVLPAEKEDESFLFRDDLIFEVLSLIVIILFLFRC